VLQHIQGAIRAEGEVDDGFEIPLIQLRRLARHHPIDSRSTWRERHAGQEAHIECPVRADVDFGRDRICEIEQEEGDPQSAKSFGLK
jgi:hypothetical protein